MFTRLALQLFRPCQKTQQLPALGPHESKNCLRGQGFRTHATVGLHAPAQKLAAPRSQPVAPRRIPQETQRCKQGESSGLKYRDDGALRAGRNRAKQASNAPARDLCELLRQLKCNLSLLRLVGGSLVHAQVDLSEERRVARIAG